MRDFASIEEIISASTYFPSGATFFSHFKPAWEAVKGQVWKLETRQVYVEDGNKSYDLMMAGDLPGAIMEISAVRAQDIGLYQRIAKRKVDFVRCRPVSVPLSKYLEWEFHCYDFNSRQGERIFLLPLEEWVSHFDSVIRYDFMIFDAQQAFIHDYDVGGKIKGGWVTEANSSIQALLCLFAQVKSRSQDFRVSPLVPWNNGK